MKNTIPLNIFQTWYTLDLPHNMKKNINKLQKNNPEFKYHLYDDDMCRKFIEKHFETNVLYAFNKLKAGAYKADLWRYCVLYIYGGIYLDIKFKCADGFKLIKLTNKEYFVKDRYSVDVIGIYQALLVCFPNNKILYKCIMRIVDNVINNYYGTNPLHPTGPHLLCEFFNRDEINNLDLHLHDNGKEICNVNNDVILKHYSEYRNEQRIIQKNSYYGDLWHNNDIFNIPILDYKTRKNFAKTLTAHILGDDIKFHCFISTIIKHDGNYIINLKWSNNDYNKTIILNSKIIIDKNLNELSDNLFLHQKIFTKDCFKYNQLLFYGFDNIKFFKFGDEYYYFANCVDKNNNACSMTSDTINFNKELPYNLTKNFISDSCCCDFTPVKYCNKLCVIYNWFPMKISEINFDKNELIHMETKYNTPDYFKNACCSSNGYEINNEIWFVLFNSRNNNYYHFFAVFDLNLNLLRYSEIFKFDNCKKELCNGLIIDDSNIILSCQTNITIYNIDYINNKLKWFSNNF